MEMSRFLYEVGFFVVLRAQFVMLPRCPHVICKSSNLTWLREFRSISRKKYQTVPRPNRRATVYFGTQLISVGCILLKKISMWALPTVPLFAGKSRFFTRNVPLKTSPGWQVWYKLMTTWGNFKKTVAKWIRIMGKICLLWFFIK